MSALEPGGSWNCRCPCRNNPTETCRRGGMRTCAKVRDVADRIGDGFSIGGLGRLRPGMVT